jgi:hypothetical protein
MADRYGINVAERCKCAARREHIPQPFLGAPDATKQAASVEAKDRPESPMRPWRPRKCLFHHFEAGHMITAVRPR